MMKKLVALLLAAMLAAAVLPGAALADSARKTVYVSSTGSGTLNLRSGPGKAYEAKGYVYHGDTVTVLNRSGEWSKVRTASGRTGWIKTKYIDGTTRALGTGTRTVLTYGNSVNLRSGPGTGYTIKGSVQSGASVKVLNTEDDWVKVTVFNSGQTGWIMAKFIDARISADAAPSWDEPAGPISVCRVTASSLNVRQGAGTGYGLTGTLYSGQAFKVLGQSGNWYRIEAFNGPAGWVSRNYAAAGATATVTASSLNMRRGAGANAGWIKSLPFGTSVSVDAVTGNWAHVRHGGQSGYVSLNYLAF